MGAGLPVISTHHAGIPEAVLHGINGFLVNEFDVEGMAKRMVELAMNEELRMKMGVANKERANTLFNWETERNKLFEVLNLKNNSK